MLSEGRLVAREKKIGLLEDVSVNIMREGDGYVALGSQLDIASQGVTREKALNNLIEAVELFLNTADSSEIERRLNEYDARTLEVANHSTEIC